MNSQILKLVILFAISPTISYPNPLPKKFEPPNFEISDFSSELFSKQKVDIGRSHYSKNYRICDNNADRHLTSLVVNICEHVEVMIRIRKSKQRSKYKTVRRRKRRMIQNNICY